MKITIFCDMEREMERERKTTLIQYTDGINARSTYSVSGWNKGPGYGWKENQVPFYFSINFYKQGQS